MRNGCFGSKKPLKNEWSKHNFWSKNFSSKLIFNQKRCLPQNFEFQKNLRYKKTGGSQNCVLQKMNSSKLLGSNNIGFQMVLIKEQFFSLYI